MDKTTKILLTAIALGLWANVSVSYVKSAKADDYLLSEISSTLDSIESKVNAVDNDIGIIANDQCINKKIC